MSPDLPPTAADLALMHARGGLKREQIARQRSSSPETIHAFGLGTLEVGGAAALFATAVPWAGANSIVQVGVDRPTSPAELHTLITPFRAAGLPFTVTLSPLAQPAALPHWLTDAGLIEQEPQWVLERHLSTEDLQHEPEHLSIRRLDDHERPAFARMMLGDDAPPEQLAYVGRSSAPNTLRRYGVFLEGQLIAAAQMTVVGRLVHVSGAATLPAFRGRGAQGALLRRRLADAVHAGCDLATVEVSVTNTASLRNVERAGFQRRYQERHFLWAPPDTGERVHGSA